MLRPRKISDFCYLSVLFYFLSLPRSFGTDGVLGEATYRSAWFYGGSGGVSGAPAGAIGHST
jgi:hypothetical protein